MKTTLTQKSAKVAQAAQKPVQPAKVAQAAQKPVQPAKVAQAAQKPVQPAKSAFRLIAGTAVILKHAGLKKAVAYHVAKGNLERTNDGIKLTPQGATLWAKERIESAPDQFQAVAAFVRNGGQAPDGSRWGTGGSPVEIAEGLRFPPLIHWGSFATSFMRQAFASIWAK